MYPEDEATEIWKIDDIQFSIVRHDSMGHWCGYCRFPKRPTIEQGYNGILTYVPVHGGITYSDEGDDGTIVYGFDCAHAGDESDPKVTDLIWLRSECERMAAGILLAAKFEKRYLLAKRDKTKGKIIDAYHQRMREAHEVDFNLQDNFGAMINVLFGKL